MKGNQNLKSSHADGTARLPSTFMEHGEYNVLHVESEQQVFKRPMKGQAIVPQWWMDVTPHERLDFTAKKNGEDIHSVLSADDDCTYAEIFVPRREPVSPLTIHTSSPSWEMESHARGRQHPEEFVKVTVYGEGSMDNISQIMDPSTPSSSFVGAVPDLDMTESDDESEHKDEEVARPLEVQSDPGFVKRSSMALEKKRTSAADQEASETMSTTHHDVSESSSWIGRDHHKPIRRLSYSKPKVLAASAQSVNEIWIKAQRNMSFSYTRRRTLLDEPALNYQKSLPEEDENDDDETDEAAETTNVAVITPERNAASYELGSRQEI